MIFPTQCHPHPTEVFPMLTSDQNFVGSIPANYDRYLRPLIFEPYAQDLAERAAALYTHNILETAAGTGVVTAAITKALRSDNTLVATDLNPAMLELARATVVHPAVTFQEADATALPFSDGSFDLVVCQFGIMFFPDKIAGCKEAFRVLRKGGTFLFNVWDKLAFNELPAIVNASVAALFPDNPSQFMERTPHGYCDIDQVRATLGAAGFASVMAEVLPKRSRAASAREPAIGFCQGTPMRSEIESRDPSKLQWATDLSTQAIVAKFGNGPIDAAIQAIVFTATKA
jgi:SAM-dependent methyltransferase